MVTAEVNKIANSALRCFVSSTHIQLLPPILATTGTLLRLLNAHINYVNRSDLPIKERHRQALGYCLGLHVVHHSLRTQRESGRYRHFTSFLHGRYDYYLDLYCSLSRSQELRVHRDLSLALFFFPCYYYVSLSQRLLCVRSLVR